jgi:hypothetical protein
LDILWELRLNPNLSLFRRAFVNNLIAYTVDPRQYPDSDKFAQEAIDLVAMLRKEGDADAEDALNALEDQAKAILKGIKNKRSDRRRLGTLRSQRNEKRLVNVRKSLGEMS